MGTASSWKKPTRQDRNVSLENFALDWLAIKINLWTKISAPNPPAHPSPSDALIYHQSVVIVMRNTLTNIFWHLLIMKWKFVWRVRNVTSCLSLISIPFPFPYFLIPLSVSLIFLSPYCQCGRKWRVRQQHITSPTCPSQLLSAVVFNVTNYTGL